MNFIIGIGGGISAYKTLSLIRLLKKAKHNVKVILTQSAMEFVTPTSVTALSENPTYTDLWSVPESTTTMPTDEHNMHHITLAKWADFIIIAPATANRISLLAQGNCQDLLSNVILASKAPVAIAPAMNVQMWNNIATQRNIDILYSRGIKIFAPASGEQACGDNGQGRLLEPEQLMAEINHWTRPASLSFKHLIITAGSTQEPLDPVRYIGNYSSGRMGIEIANIAYRCGAQVTLIHASVNADLLDTLAAEITTIAVQTAEQMLTQVNTQIAQGQQNNQPCEVFIGCAAVADYRPEQYSQQKIKKTEGEELILKLTKNPDIIAQVATNKKDNLPFVSGFALESEQLIPNAEKKLTHKKMDLIFANPVASINAAKSTITALWQEQGQLQQKEFAYEDKAENALHILKLISQRYER